ncbi:MAG: pyruvate synthase subunit PorA [Thermodesulfobacteriota bacterium]|nr:pyruvate synthase subunit PorA [Thermodesulfobacteriota bacterium]
METQIKGHVRVLDGNRAAAWSVLLSRPDVVALYPITPQTQVVEQLSQFHAEGLLHAEMVEVEGENSAMSTVLGASVAGGRVFTATSSWGLEFMHDVLLVAAGMRVPVVMVNVNRESTSIPAVAVSRQDVWTERDSGWIHIEAETCQEVLDSIVMAYRLAEDPDVLLPVMISYDGFYLSYLSERVEIPTQEDVDRFLTPVAQTDRPKIVPGELLSFGGFTFPESFAEYRMKHCLALERAKEKIEEIDRAYHRAFDRSYGGVIEEYRTEDAEIVIVGMGTEMGTAKGVIDETRDEGMKVGLIRVRMYRPFPKERLAKALMGKRTVGVIDKSVCFGWNCGHLFMEMKPVILDLDKPIPMADFIGGLASADITKDQIRRVIKSTFEASQGKPYREVTWLILGYLEE